MQTSQGWKQRGTFQARRGCGRDAPAEEVGGEQEDFKSTESNGRTWRKDDGSAFKKLTPGALWKVDGRGQDVGMWGSALGMSAEKGQM